MTVHATTGQPTDTPAEEFFTVSIHQSEVDRIARWVANHPDCETGGNLFGFWTHGRAPAVQLTLGPGPGADHQLTAFFQDVDHLRTHGRRAQELYGLQHIGDWHSHHRLGLAEPSGGDASTTLRTLQTNGFERFVIFIANISDEPRDRGWRRRREFTGLVRLNAFLFERGRSTFRRGRFLVLPEESPIAHSAAQQGITEPYAPGSVRVRLPLASRTPTQSASHAQGWYSRPAGTEFLRAVDTACRQQFTDCRILVRSDDGILRYEFATRKSDWEMVFPAAFPHEPAELIRDGKRFKPIEAGRTPTPDDFCRQILESVHSSESGGPSLGPPDHGTPSDQDLLPREDLPEEEERRDDLD
ncbi:hypothetical protein ACPCHT_09225 [Nucisporomicrobium flavum]|uniref:hypothetical protein n=1 Tax=Nucisporomicrobium flavum TaxID=2785915 RepID=UPI003C2DAB24